MTILGLLTLDDCLIIIAPLSIVFNLVTWIFRRQSELFYFPRGTVGRGICIIISGSLVLLSILTLANLVFAMFMPELIATLTIILNMYSTWKRLTLSL